MPAMKGSIDRLLAIMARLRDPAGGCPWDLEQTFATIAPHTIEEAYETVEAIETGNRAALKDELGDLLFQVVFHARMAEEEGSFDFNDVVAAICDKMERRHPHVFGDSHIPDAESQIRAWEDQKSRERAESAPKNAVASALDGVTATLPALTLAAKLQARAARVGFDWDRAERVIEKLDEEIAELRAEMAQDAPRPRIEDEVGDILFTCVNLARKLGIDPETALRHGNRKFESRFRSVEQALANQGKNPSRSSLNEMEELWTAAKTLDRQNGDRQNEDRRQGDR